MPKRQRYFTRGKGLSKKEKKEVVKTIDRKLKENIEMKRHDQAYSIVGNFLLVDRAYYMTCLTDIVLGDLDSNRIGDKVRLDNYFEMQISLQPQFGVVSDYVPSRTRIIIFQWKDRLELLAPGASALPDIENILVPGQYANSVSADITSRYNWDTKESYKIIYDKFIQLDSSTGNQSWHVDRHRVKFPRGVRRKINYENGDINGSNKIFLLMMSDQPTGVFAPASFWSFRFPYSDA